MRHPRSSLIGLTCLAATVPAGIGAAVPIDLRDPQGRVIHFDAADAATAAPLAQTLGDLIHGDEVSNVLIRVLSPAALSAVCGADSVGCYGSSSNGSSTITVPSGSTGSGVLVHEYGHHIERARRSRFSAYLSGVPQWSQARGVDGLLSTRGLALDYSLGWERSALEIFAEDYVQLHTPGSWRITAIGAPTSSVLDALRRDLTAPSPALPPAAPAPTPPPIPGARPAAPTTANPPGAAPVRIARTEIRGKGRLRPGRRAAFAFHLDAPGRSLVVGVRLAGRARAGARAEVTCDGRRVARHSGRVGQPISFRVGNQGPAGCRIVLTGTSKPVGYRLLLRQEGPTM